jgi:GDP-4-dehydro-6-deoxy-D-mannose reductase
MEIVGVGLPTDRLDNIEHILQRISVRHLDLGVYTDVVALLREARPDHIYHLAAQASVPRAWADPEATLCNNIVAQLNVLRACVELDLKARILVVGSADEYGLIPEEAMRENSGIGEDTPLRPANPYAVSKIAQDYLGLQYHLSHGLHIVRVRPFNHIGPRQGLGFVVPDFCQQIAAIEAGEHEPIMRVGNLEARRDITDVRDMVRGYHLALTRGEAGQVYNIGSGRAHAIRDILDRLLGMSRVAIEVEPDPERMRPSDVPIMVCDNRRFVDDTGWQPTIALETSLRDALDDWRTRVTVTVRRDERLRD